MTAASWALQRSIYQALVNSSELTTLLGGDRIYSDAPPATPFPYITLGQTVNQDWSTGTEDGLEHSLTLHVWSRASGSIEVHEIIQVIRMVLHNQALSSRIIIWSISATSTPRRGSMRTARPCTVSCAIAR
nr:DUF3168 domain-containing protein [Methyloceanibacter superfactus]